MSYCVHCGVELDSTASFCPLCHTPVLDPGQPVDTVSPPPFPTRRGEVPPVSKWELALLLSAMLASVAVCCGILNFFFVPQRTWSLYISGACLMLWLWFVPPLLLRGMPMLVRLLVDVLAVAVYVLLIAVDLDGMDWYVPLALPIILWGGACVFFLGALLGGGRRSILTSVTLVIGTIGVFLVGLEIFIDRVVLGRWEPGWSLVVLTVCVALIIPLVVVRRVPSLREEVRRRFHM